MNNNTDSHHKLQLAAEFVSEGKYLQALQILIPVYEQNPDQTDIILALSDLYERLNNNSCAENILKEDLEKNPGNAEIRNTLGSFYIRKSKYSSAVEILTNADEKLFPIVLFQCAYCYFMMGELKLSSRSFKEYINTKINSPLLFESYLYLAKIDIVNRNFSNALNNLKNISVAYSNNWERLLLLAITYYELAMYTNAAGSIESAKKLNPEEASLYNWAGKIYLSLEDFARSEQNFLDYLDRGEKLTSEAYFSLAEIYSKCNKPEHASAYYEIAAKLSSGYNSNYSVNVDKVPIPLIKKITDD